MHSTAANSQGGGGEKDMKRVVRLPCCVCKHIIDIEYSEFEKVTGCPLAPAPIDTSFQFKCESCEGGACFFSHAAKNWSQLLATAMYNMHQRQERFDYLFTDKVLDFIEVHQEILKPILVGKSDMRTRLARALREHRESFESLMARSGQYKLKRMTYDDTQPRMNLLANSNTNANNNIAVRKMYNSSNSNSNSNITTASPSPALSLASSSAPSPSSSSSSSKLPSISSVMGLSQEVVRPPSAKELSPKDHPPAQQSALLASSEDISVLYQGRFPIYYDPLPRAATHVWAWLECIECGQAVKTDCNNLRGDNEDIKFMIPGPGDNEYNYWCASCSEYEIFYHHNCKNWNVILTTAVYNLERFHGRQYFSLEDGIFPFIETHWQVLCNGKSKQDDWKKTCASVISAKMHSEAFVSKDGYWALKYDDVVPDIKNRLRVEKIVERRRRDNKEECNVKWLGLADTYNTWVEGGQIVVPNKSGGSNNLTTSYPPTPSPWFNDVLFPTKPRPPERTVVGRNPHIEIVDSPNAVVEDYSSSGDNSVDNNESAANSTPQTPCAPPDQFMQCYRCLQIIEIDFSAGKVDDAIYPGPHDSNYSYCCSSCNGGTPEISHSKKTSLEFLSTALQNLRIKKGYNEFHLNDIYAWSTDNFQLLRTSIAATADSWKSNFRWVLSHNPDKFQSTQRGCWGLKTEANNAASPSSVKSEESPSGGEDSNRSPITSKPLASNLEHSKTFTHAAHHNYPKYANGRTPHSQLPRWAAQQTSSAYPNLALPPDWQAAPPGGGPLNYENSPTTLQKGAYEFKPSEYFMPSYSPFPDWISSAMIPGTALKRKYSNFPQTPAAYYPPPQGCCDVVQPERRPPIKHVSCSGTERTREVFLCSENEKSFVGFVHISPKSSLAELRCKIQNEGVRIGDYDFIFLYKGAPVGREQERKTLVKDCAADRLGKTTVIIRDVLNSEDEGNSSLQESEREEIRKERYSGEKNKNISSEDNNVRPTKIRKSGSINIRRSAVEKIINKET